MGARTREREGARETKKKRTWKKGQGTGELLDQVRGRSANSLLIPQVINTSVLSRTPLMMWAKVVLLWALRVIQNMYAKKLKLKTIDI